MPYPNRYYLVSQRVTVAALTGYRPSNVFYGASRAHFPVYDLTLAEPGDEVHDLVGGRFLVRQGGEVVELGVPETSPNPYHDGPPAEARIDFDSVAVEIPHASRRVVNRYRVVHT